MVLQGHSQKGVRASFVNAIGVRGLTLNPLMLTAAKISLDISKESYSHKHICEKF